MSGDWVAVNPERLDQAASKLEALRDVLAANIPVITSMMNAYSSDGLTVPELVQALSQALARTPQDAADMRARSRLAWYLDRTEPPGVPGPGQTSWMIEIPWDRQQVDQEVAPLEAQALIAAVDNKDPAAARAQLAAIAQDLGDHSQDAEFLKAFMAQPGVEAAMEKLPGVLRTTQDGKTVKRARKSDLDNVLTVLASVAIPLGFSSKNAYMSFNNTLMDGLEKAGYPNAVAAFQGSSVTGIRYETGERVGDNPGDYDIAIADPDLFSKAKNLGIDLKNQPSRTMPLSEEQADELGLGDVQQELTSQAGRPVNIVVFESYDGVKLSGPALRVPFLYQVKNYFAKQGQVAAQDETAVETEQAQEEEQAQIAEEEAEAEAEAEAMMMAEDDE